MNTNATNATDYIRRLTAHIDPFLDGFRAAGYAPAAVTSRRLIINAFIRSIASKRRAIKDLSDADVTAFLERRPTRREDPRERAVLRRLIAHLRAEGVCSPTESRPVTPAEAITQRYVAFLRQDRGLAENSIAVYAPCARDFFTYCVTQVGHLALQLLEADTVRTFLLGRIANRSTESSRLLSVSMRSVLRFLFLRGETPRDLLSAVPMVRTSRHSTVPAVLSTDEVQRVLATPDRSTVAVGAMGPSCSSWPDLGCARAKWSFLSLATCTGVPAESSSAAKDLNGIMCRCSPTSATPSRDTSSTAVARVPRTASFSVSFRHASG